MFRSLTFIMVVVVTFVFTAEVELYSDNYDYVNIDEILSNGRLREQYYKCFMDQGPCITPDANFFKDNIGESILTKCAKCTEQQKTKLAKMVEWYVENDEEKWNAAVAKFLEDAKQRKLGKGA